MHVVRGGSAHELSRLKKRPDFIEQSIKHEFQFSSQHTKRQKQKDEKHKPQHHRMDTTLSSSEHLKIETSKRNHDRLKDLMALTIPQGYTFLEATRAGQGFVTCVRDAIKLVHRVVFDTKFYPESSWCGAGSSRGQSELSQFISKSVRAFEFEITRSLPPPPKIGSADMDELWHIELSAGGPTDTLMFGVLHCRANVMRGWNVQSDREQVFYFVYCACFQSARARDAYTLDWSKFVSDTVCRCPPLILSKDVDSFLAANGGSERIPFTVPLESFRKSFPMESVTL